MTASSPLATGESISVLGANVYLFTARMQNRFLAEVLAPGLPALASGRDGFRFWFDRFDARGPHLFLLFWVEASEIDDLRAQMEALISDFLESSRALGPSADNPSAARIEELHAACSGKSLCQADRLAGMAEEFDFEMFTQPDSGYPFHLTPTHGPRDAVWSQVSDLSRWCLEQRLAAGEKPATAAALRLVASLDRELERSPIDPLAYWHRHVQSLMPNIDTLLEEKGSGVVEGLLTSVGEQNRGVFERVWSWAETAQPAWEGLPTLLLCLGERPSTEAVRLLREIVHVSLKQLGLSVPKHFPVVLYAWASHRLSAVPVEVTES